MALLAATLVVACEDKEGGDSGTETAVPEIDTNDTSGRDTATEADLASVIRIYCDENSEGCQGVVFDGTESTTSAGRTITDYQWTFNGENLDGSETAQYEFAEIEIGTLYEGELTVSDDSGATNTTAMMMYATSATGDCEETSNMIWTKLIRPGFTLGGQCVMQAGLVGGCYNPKQTYGFEWTDSSGTTTTLSDTVDATKEVIKTSSLIDSGTGQLKITKTICESGVWTTVDYCFDVTCSPSALPTISYSQVSCSR